MNRLALYAIFLTGLTLTGCINLTTRLQADDLTVQATHEGNDCVPIIFGIGIGTATVEQAIAKAQNVAEVERAKWNRKRADDVPADPIQRIRRLQFSDYEFMAFGARCIEVTGEAAGVKAAAK